MNIRLYNAKILTMEKHKDVFEGEIWIKNEKIAYLGETKKLQAQIDALQKQLIENERQKQAAIDALLRKEVLNLLGFKPTDLKQPADVTKVTDKLSQLLATKKKAD